MKTKLLAFFLTLIVVCIAIVHAEAQQALIQVIPASYTVQNVGLTFNINVTIQNVNDLFGYEFKLYYPNNVLNGTSVTQGSFLKTGGIQTFFVVPTFNDQFNATHGILNVLCSRMGNVSGISGSGTLVTAIFTSTSTDGPKTLSLHDVKLSDSNLSAIPFTTSDGEVTVIPEFPAIWILPVLGILTLAAAALGKNRKP